MVPESPTIVIGIDPGYGRMGFGILSCTPRAVTCIHYGCVETPKHDPLPTRLNTIYTELVALFTTYQPRILAVEKLYFAKNVTTALDVGHARGVILLAATQHAITIHEFAPSHVKQAATGVGNADKQQVQKMIQLLLKLPKPPKPDDAADALAVALCASRLSPFPLS